MVQSGFCNTQQRGAHGIVRYTVYQSTIKQDALGSANGNTLVPYQQDGDSSMEIGTRQAFQPILCRSRSLRVLKQRSCPQRQRQVNWTKLGFSWHALFFFNTTVLRSHTQCWHLYCPFGTHLLHPSKVEMCAPFDQQLHIREPQVCVRMSRDPEMFAPWRSLPS